MTANEHGRSGARVHEPSGSPMARVITAALAGGVAGVGLGRWWGQSSVAAPPAPAPAPAPAAVMVPETVELYFDETKEAYAHLIEVIGKYRSNTTTVLTIATGATAFFGFAQSDKHLFYYLALVAYGLAALFGMLVFKPRGLRTNMAGQFQYDLGLVPPLSSSEARYLMLKDRQAAIGDAETSITTISALFRTLIACTAATVVLAGVSVALDRPDPTAPTHIVIDTP